jgi:hypothetical protein
MSIYFAGIYYKLDNTNVFRIFAYYDLDHISVFKRSYAKKFINLLGTEFIKSHDSNEIFMVMEHKHTIYNYKIHLLTEDKKYYFITITNTDYKIKISRLFLCDISVELQKKLINNKIKKYVLSDIDIYDNDINLIIGKYKNYSDKIDNIKENLDELTQIMKNNIDIIIVRDFKINELLEKTAKLSSQSDTFNKSASKINKWCRLC